MLIHLLANPFPFFIVSSTITIARHSSHLNFFEDTEFLLHYNPSILVLSIREYIRGPKAPLTGVSAYAKTTSDTVIIVSDHSFP